MGKIPTLANTDSSKALAFIFATENIADFHFVFQFGPLWIIFHILVFIVILLMVLQRNKTFLDNIASCNRGKREQLQSLDKCPLQ